MPLVSALNGDNRNIPTGSPVAGKFNRLQLDRVIRAGGSVLAAGIVTNGGPVGSVINLRTEGVVDLNDWTLATGSRYLTVGVTYRLSSQIGKITPSGSGQTIGLAVSQTQLSLQIGSNDSEEAASEWQAALAAETAERIAADDVLTTSISTEANARIAADNALQAQITANNEPAYSRILLMGGM